MNTKKRFTNLYKITPEYPRIPHLNKHISNMSHDDIQLDFDTVFPLDCWVQEKIDGANMGLSWTNGPIIRNRNNILKKGYIKKDTPSKVQFRSSWNWIHSHNADIQKLSKSLMTQVTVYGEWMYAKHSILYDKLPDLFIAYDIYLPEYDEWVSPDIFKNEMIKTNIMFIDPIKTTFKSINEVSKFSELPSDYRSGGGIREGIVIKQSDGRKLIRSFKIVNSKFIRREDFNDELIKNIILK